VAGYRATAHLLGLNKNTVQRISQPKGWQVRRRPVGKRPRAESMPSVASRPGERWATGMAPRVVRRPGSLVRIDTRDGLPHSGIVSLVPVSRRGNAKAAEAALEETLISRFGPLARLPNPPEASE
jgi:putative transposase